jgi:hypothetical protein
MRDQTVTNLLIIAAAIVLGVSLCSPARAQSGTAALSGTVTDADGAILPGAEVTVVQKETGYSRTVITGGDGGFLFPSLPPADYDVTVRLQGFATLTSEKVTLNVATTRKLDLTMQVAAVEQTIVVTAEAPLMPTTAAIGTVVSQEELENLPLNGRQFANLGVLAPGTSLAYNTDPTKPGQLTVQLNGGIGRNVNYVVDGGDNTDDTIGGALQNFSLTSVQEFNIQTAQYKAEYGRSSGGVLSVVTKTGTNQLHGEGYGFFRSDSLNAKTETEKQAGIDKQAYDRKQYGFSLGGPIVKDKAHFFATYERVDRETNYAVDTGGLFPTYDGTVVPLPFQDDLVSAKLTYNASASQFLQVRYGYQKNSDKYGASPLAAPNGIGTVANRYESILAGHTASIGNNSLNEFVFQYTTFANNISADSNEPLIYYPSGFHTGQNLNTPQSTYQTKYQFKDDFSYSTELWGTRHDIKFGVNYVHEPELKGDFSTGLAGQYTAMEDAIGSPITLIQQYGGFFGQSTPMDLYSGYVQDDWFITDRLTLNIGLRYDYWDYYNVDQRTNTIWQTLHEQRQYDESYLQDFWSDDGILDDDTNNVGPRIGFAWDITGEGRHTIRGGYGTFYDFPYVNATILFPAGQVQSDYGLTYQNYDENGIRNPDGSFFQPGDPLPPNQGGELSGDDEVASPTLATPYSDQWNLGWAWRATEFMAVTVDLVSIDYHDIPFRFRINVNDPDTGEPRFPDFGLFRLWYGGGRASYDAVNLGVRIRRPKYEIQGFYTYSEAEGNVLAGADEFRLTDTQVQADVGGTRLLRDQSINPLDPLCDECFGPLSTDAAHRLTLGGLWRAPWGLIVSGMFRYRSALPYMEHANEDLNGDGSNMDLRPGVPHVNSGRGFDFKQFDLRLSKEFTVSGSFGFEVIAEVFNLFNSTNPARPNRYGEASVYAGDPLQGEQQLGQLGLRLFF